MAAEVGFGPAIVGRTETVRALRRRFEEARRGTGGVTLLVGDTGVGKSTLISELVREFRGQGAQVFVGRAPALDEAPPYSLIQSALDSVRDGSAARSKPEDESAPGDERILVGFTTRALEAVSSAPPTPEGRLLELLGESGGTSPRPRDSVVMEIAERFLELTRQGPTTLVLDDLERADELSLAAVEFLANALKTRALWILATSRPFGSLPKAGRTRFAQLERATGAQQIPLPALTSAEVADYLAKSDPSRRFSPQEIASRFSESGGNPLLLEQIARRASTGGEPPGPPGTGASPLAAEAQQTLELAAVIGPRFGLDLLVRAGGEAEARVTEIVDNLVGRGLLIEHAEKTLTFPNDRLRGETYGHLSAERRSLLHRKVGEALEAMEPPSLTRAFALARHFYLGREAQKSVRYNRIAALFAERALAPDVAADHIARALESQRELSPDDPDGAAELVLELARLKEELGSLKDAKAILRDFLEREKENSRLSPRRRATLEIFLSRVLTDEGNAVAAATLAEKVLASPGIDHELVIRMAAHRQIGLTLYYSGRYAEALAHHTEEIRLAREAGNELVLLRAQVWRIADLQMLGQTEQAIAEARETTLARDRFGSARESGQAHLFLGDILADARSTPAQRQEAVAEYAAAIGFAETAHDPRRIAWASYKTGELLREAARKSRESVERKNLLKEATEKLERARGLFVQMGDQVGLSVTLKVRGQIAMDQGAYVQAETDLLEARHLLQGLHHDLEEIDVVLRLGQLAYARGDRTKAQDLLAELELKNVHAARPDLEAEFEQLRKSLGV